MVAFRSASVNLNAGTYTNLTIPRPSGLQEGDFVIVMLFINDDNINGMGSPAPFGAWDDATGFNSFYGIWLFTGFARASEPVNWNFDWDSPSAHCGGVALAYSDVDPDNPIEAWAKDISTTSDPIGHTGNLTDVNQMLVSVAIGYDFAATDINWTSTDNIRINESLYPVNGSCLTVGAADKTGVDSGSTEVNLNPSNGGINSGGGYVLVLNSASTDHEISGSSSSSSATEGALALDVEIAGSSSSFSSVNGNVDTGQIGPGYADYEFFIDWDNDGGLRVSGFESVLGQWEAHGTTPPELSLSTDQAFEGTQSLYVNWREFHPFTFGDADSGFDEGTFGVTGTGSVANLFTFGDSDSGFDEGAFGLDEAPIEIVSAYISLPLTNLVPGKIYTMSMYLFPVNNHVHYKVGDTEVSDPTTVLNFWQEVTVEFIPTSSDHMLYLYPEEEPTNDDGLYIDYIRLTGQFEQVVPQNEFSFSYGRDDSRALSPVSPAETELEFLDLTGRYSPLNENSELAPNINAGREVNIRALYDGQYYSLFWGLLDDVSVDQSTGERNATFSIVDIMAFVGQTKLNTEVYKGKRTGELIHIILDEIGWPTDRRDIDAGATPVAWWWAFDIDASDAISELVASEGLPAYAVLSPTGDFVFRDRHHRLLSDRSKTSQAILSSSENEPMFSAPMELDLGWKDVINSVELDVTPRAGAQYYRERVWKMEGVLSLSVGETREIQAVTENPFVQARVPIDSTDPFAIRLGIPGGDYTLLAGSVDITLSRTSGHSTIISVQNTGATAAAILDLSLYAVPVEEGDAQKITRKDASSIASVNRESSHNLETPWANLNDSHAIADITLGQRASRLPTVSITVNNGNHERMTEVLNRQISDRIRIKEPRSFVNHEFFIEGLSHNINAAGKFHEVTFSCEQIPVYDETVTPFTFGDSTAGFDQGVFGFSGISSANTLFVLDETNLDEGLLAY